jgi:dipeptidyl aminopeptidase/acylaminoacyl peptidase
VQAIVSYFGASNLTTILPQSTPYGLGIRTPALKAFLGALPEENQAVAKLASPVFQVDASDPPLLLLHGDQDPQMPINQSHELQGAYEKLGLDAVLVVVHGAAHGGDAFYDAERIERVASFLDASLRRELTSDSAQR